MSTKHTPIVVISSAVERAHGFAVISSAVERSPNAKQYYPRKIPTTTVIQRV